MKRQNRDEAEYQTTPLYPMDETQPLAPPPVPPSNRNNSSNDTPQRELGNGLKFIMSKAIDTSADTRRRYKPIYWAVILSWISSAVILGLCAFLVARVGPGWLRSVAIVNMILAASGTLLTLGLDLRFPISRSQPDPRPSIASYVYILAKGLFWTLAAVAIIATATTDERSGSSFTKRRGGRGDVGPATPGSIAMGVGFMDCLVVASTLVYWKFPVVALVKRYSEHETRRMYSLMLAPGTRGGGE
ncbi:hypothetical protein ASPCAL06290 [Aspergillus calidoustus]|uniref:Uncharacterized protein n=1 Tax=Aspergillus calidoustus TaxID=454130 RepID=A0A0U5G0L8_ASPCI|nr:hypothetical protein ASPCAL06290 [Aspergillus calidoustus]